MLRQIELASGLLAGVTAVVVPYVVAFSGLTDHMLPRAWAFFALFSATLILAAIGSLLHGRWNTGIGLIVLWATALLSLGHVVISLLSVGIFLLPATLLVFLAAIAGTLVEWRGDQRTEDHR